MISTGRSEGTHSATQLRLVHVHNDNMTTLKRLKRNRERPRLFRHRRPPRRRSLPHPRFRFNRMVRHRLAIKTSASAERATSSHLASCSNPLSSISLLPKGQHPSNNANCPPTLGARNADTSSSLRTESKCSRLRATSKRLPISVATGPSPRIRLPNRAS